MNKTIAVMLGLALAACSDAGETGTADVTGAEDAAGALDAAAQDAAMDAAAPDAIDPFGGKDAASPDATPDTLSDAAGSDAGDGAEPDAADTATPPDAATPPDTTPTDTTAPDAQACAPIDHTPLQQAELGAITLDAAAAEPLTLHWRRALPGASFTDSPMTDGGIESATIPSSAVTFAGIDYWISAAGCAATHPEGAPDALHHIDIIGELRITADPDVYDYLPDVDGHRVVWAKEAQGGTGDNVWLFDLHTFETTKLTSIAKPQGDAHVSGDNVVWVDGRNVKNEWDPNQDIYLWDLAAAKESPVVTAPLGQYGVTIRGRIAAWRDDRHMGGPIDGDIYLYDMGPDGIMGTTDDRGEHRLTPDPADQTAPAVAVDDDGRVRVVWADFRDDADGKCAQDCDWNVYLSDSGPDGIFGTGDDIGPVQVTSQPAEQQSPTTWGQRIAWLDARGGNWLDPDVWVYDLGPDRVYGTADDGGESALPAPVKEPDHLSMWGDRMVYEDFRNDTWDVWIWDFAAGTEAPVVSLPKGQFYPRLSGRTVVWQDARNNADGGEPFDDIYVRVLAE